MEINRWPEEGLIPLYPEGVFRKRRCIWKSLLPRLLLSALRHRRHESRRVDHFPALGAVVVHHPSLRWSVRKFPLYRGAEAAAVVSIFWFQAIWRPSMAATTSLGSTRFLTIRRREHGHRCGDAGLDPAPSGGEVRGPTLKSSPASSWGQASGRSSARSRYSLGARS